MELFLLFDANRRTGRKQKEEGVKSPKKFTNIESQLFFCNLPVDYMSRLWTTIHIFPIQPIIQNWCEFEVLNANTFLFLMFLMHASVLKSTSCLMFTFWLLCCTEFILPKNLFLKITSWGYDTYRQVISNGKINNSQEILSLSQ